MNTKSQLWVGLSTPKVREVSSGRKKWADKSKIS